MADDRIIPDQEIGSKIHWLSTEFIEKSQEDSFRKYNEISQRRGVLALCLISISVAVLMQYILGGQPKALPPALAAIRLGYGLTLLFMLVAVWRRFEYRFLDLTVGIFATLVVSQTYLLTDIADPDRLGLLARNVVVIATGYLLLPTRYLVFAMLLTVQALLTLYQLVTFYNLEHFERLSVIAVVILLYLTGTIARRQREISGRQRFRVMRQRDNYLGQLKDSENRLRLVTNSLPVFIAYVDNQQRLQYANQTGHVWYQLPGTDVFGKTLKELIAAEYEDVRPYVEKALQGQTVHFERVVQYPDGKTRTVDITHIPHINNDGEVLGYFSQTVDLTEIKKSELELMNARREAEAANQTKSEFMANMSHELRTPLNAVIGFSSALSAGMAGELEGKQKEYIKDIENSGEHLLSLINDLLDLSKIEAGKLEIQPEEVDVEDQIERCLPFVKEQAQKGGVRLKHLPADHLPQLHADPRMLRQMIVNLLSNAVKFSPRESTVSISAVEDSHGQLAISVRDQGPGMSEEDIPRALTPFVQTESGMKTGGGTGLGLPLVKEMMILHGGSLELQSIVGQGTTALLHFPVNDTTSGQGPTV